MASPASDEVVGMVSRDNRAYSWFLPVLLGALMLAWGALWEWVL